MTRHELYKIRENWLKKNLKYKMSYWSDYDYSILSNILYKCRSGRGINNTFNDCIIMADTETSKKQVDENYVDEFYFEIKNYILKYSLKWKNDYKIYGSKKELRDLGLKFNGNDSIDSLYQDLVNQYQWIFEEKFNELDELDAIIYYLSINKPKYIEEIKDNHICAWTISIRAFNMNFCTLWGRKPSEMIECINLIMLMMEGDETFIYFHNLSYDYTFLRKFMFQSWGTPDKQLNTKPHYPIYIKFNNGLTIKDSLILAQRGLEKWAKDMDVEHQKAVGCWDYDIIRNQDYIYNEEELKYIENDTLAGVECLQATLDILKKNISTIPYTATGIPREAVRKIGKENRARDRFLSLCLTFEQYIKCEKVFHGGFTHANRHLIDVLIDELVECYDFASSYPYVLLSEKYPQEKFASTGHKTIDFIISKSDKYAFMFKLIGINLDLKDAFTPMPALQYSKCEKIINPIIDNGRILSADYVEIYLNEMDLQVISEQYKFDKSICVEVEFAAKDYLPRWLTDYIFSLFVDKTKLKGGDPVAYAMAKAKLNSVYGMMVQKCIRQLIEEDYDTGEYSTIEENPEELYQKYLDNFNSILPYQVGVWVTSYAFYNLFQLGKCVSDDGLWIYSDTDSCYATKWDKSKIDIYNEKAKQKLIDNNYGCVNFNNREYWLGVAEFDGAYSEFKTLGAKRYCGRSVKDNELHITVAGVPKRGAACLKNDINNFTKGMLFLGESTGKKTHTYIYVDEIYEDKYGNETGDSIDLSACDYLLDKATIVSWENATTEEISIQIYEEEGVEDVKKPKLLL